MKRLTMMLLLLAACATNTPQKSDKAEAGEVALSCIAHLKECEDWAPIKMGDGPVPVHPEPGPAGPEVPRSRHHPGRRLAQRRPFGRPLAVLVPVRRHHQGGTGNAAVEGDQRTHVRCPVAPSG